MSLFSRIELLSWRNYFLGDQITAVNGEKFRTDDDLNRLIQTFKPGQSIQLEVTRGIHRPRSSCA